MINYFKEYALQRIKKKKKKKKKKKDPNRHNRPSNPTHLNTKKKLWAKQNQQP
jgi:hypothetical protein